MNRALVGLLVVGLVVVGLVVVAACGEAEPAKDAPRATAASARPQAQVIAVPTDGDLAPGEVLHARVAPADARAQLQNNARVAGLFAALRGRSDLVQLGALPFAFGPLPENWRRPVSVAFTMFDGGIEIYGAAVPETDRGTALIQLVESAHAPEVMADISIAGDVPVPQLVEALRLLADHGVTEVQLTSTTPYTAAAGGAAGGPTVPMASAGMPNTPGGLDKAIIRRYIKRNIQKIQYCYEKQLLAKPALQGLVQVRFVITPSGAVSTSTATGVDPEVARCVADVIKEIEFPKPKDGATVPVTYPFTFRPAGG